MGGLNAGPAIVRWPGKVPAGVVTEEMLSAHAWYTTFAALATKMDSGLDARRRTSFVADYQKSIAQYPNIKTGAEFEGYDANASATPP